MIKLPIRYRVIETWGVGNKIFRPERTHFYFFWVGFVREGYQAQKEEFSTLARANKFLWDYANKAKKEQLKKPITHNFNAVFYRLTQTDDD